MRRSKRIPWRVVAAVCAAAAASAVVLTVVTLSTAGPPTEEPADPGLVEPQPEDRPPTAAELKSLLVDVATRVGSGLRHAADDCKPECVQSPAYFKSVMEGLVRVCRRTWPDDIRASPAYDPKIHQPLLTAYERACKMLDSGSKQLGPPAQGGLWRGVIQTAADVLEGPLMAEYGKPFSPSAPEQPAQSGAADDGGRKNHPRTQDQ